MVVEPERRSGKRKASELRHARCGGGGGGSSGDFNPAIYCLPSCSPIISDAFSSKSCKAPHPPLLLHLFVSPANIGVVCQLRSVRTLRKTILYHNINSVPMKKILRILKAHNAAS